MEIPSYKELRLEPNELKNLKACFTKNKIGHVPAFFVIPALSEDKASKLIELFHQVLDEMNINPYFPYPLYFIYPFQIDKYSKILHKDKENLPLYFHCKDKALSNKEIKVFKQLVIKREKLVNFSVKKDLDSLMGGNPLQHELIELVRQNYLLENLGAKMAKGRKP